MKKMIAAYIASPGGKAMIHTFLSSPEGQRAIDDYLSTTEGQKMGKLLLQRALEGLDLPPDLKDQIRRALDTGE
jgi:hypothetical protein